MFWAVRGLTEKWADLGRFSCSGGSMRTLDRLQRIHASAKCIGTEVHGSLHRCQAPPAAQALSIPWLIPLLASFEAHVWRRG